MLQLFKNFFINLGNIFRKPRTAVYPREKIIIPEKSRGILHLKLDLDSLDVICNGCGNCGAACPEDCIKVKKGLQRMKNRYWIGSCWISADAYSVENVLRPVSWMQ